MTEIPCAIVRGGTTKGVFVLDEHLPRDAERRDRILLQLMGSPDPRQIDGLGGADPLTSKVAIIAPSQRPGIDVEYESVEVGISDARVNHGLMCGNLLAGVGYFALAEGLIPAQGPVTSVTIHCITNGKTIVAKVPLPAAPGPGLETPPPILRPDPMVRLLFSEPGGAATGRLLPAGESVCTFSLDGLHIDASIVDAGVLYAFVAADALGLNGGEDAATLDANAPMRALVEKLRAAVADRVSRYCSTHGAGVSLSPGQVKVAVIAPCQTPGDADIQARVLNREKVHKAYAVTGAICLGAAAAIPGTLVNAIVRPQASPLELRIAHPSGILAMRTHWRLDEQDVRIEASEFQRSARIILRGTTYLSGDPGFLHSLHVTTAPPPEQPSGQPSEQAQAPHAIAALLP